jgi:uncharacterized protein YprB with RNaseH-like and TPR domain
MLRNTFVHLPGVGPHRERALWNQGILDWERMLESIDSGRLRGRHREAIAERIRDSIDALDRRDAGFFTPHLPPKEMWRLYSEFADRALYLDIETTGLSGEYDDITVIGALGEGKLALFVSGINLEQFPGYVARYPLLISYNGSQFDVPFLRCHFPLARLDQPHIDLRFVLASLGYKGGLKAVESRLGLERDPSLAGVDGFEAVRLWHRYRRGDKAALERLILYNVTDVANLVELAETAVRLKLSQFPFPCLAASSPIESSRTRFDSEYLKTWARQHVSLKLFSPVPC